MHFSELFKMTKHSHFSEALFLRYHCYRERKGYLSRIGAVEYSWTFSSRVTTSKVNVMCSSPLTQNTASNFSTTLRCASTSPCHRGHMPWSVTPCGYIGRQRKETSLWRKRIRYVWWHSNQPHHPPCWTSFNKVSIIYFLMCTYMVKQAKDESLLLRYRSWLMCADAWWADAELYTVWPLTGAVYF